MTQTTTDQSFDLPGPSQQADNKAGLLPPVRLLFDEIVGPIRTTLTENSDRSQAQRAALFAFGVRVVSAGLLYVLQIALARWMGGFEYGIYVFAWTWVLVLGSVAHLGLNTAVIRLLPEYKETYRFDLMRGLLMSSTVVTLAAGTLIAAIGIAVAWAFAGQLANHYVLPVYLALVCVPLFALGDVLDGVGRSQSWIGLGLVPPYVMRPLLVIVFMFAAAVAGLPATAVTAATAAIIATWAATIVQAVLIKRRLKKIVPDGAQRYDAPHWTSISAPLLAIAAFILVLQNADVMVISIYVSPVEAGIYYAAAKTISLILFVHFAVGSAVANRYAALKARGDNEGLKSIVRDSVHWTFWPSLAAAAGILLLGKPLLWLFGPEFQQGYPLMMILVVGLLFRAAVGPSEYLLTMLGEQKRCAMLLGAAAGLNIVLNVILVPVWGGNGAAVATSASLIAAALMAHRVVRRRLGMEVAIWRNL